MTTPTSIMINGKSALVTDIVPPEVKKTDSKTDQGNMFIRATILENVIVHEHKVDEKYVLYHFDWNSNWIADAGDALRACTSDGCVEIDVPKNDSMLSVDGKALVGLCNNELKKFYIEVKESIPQLLHHYYSATKTMQWYKTLNPAGEKVNSKEIEYVNGKNEAIIGGMAIVDNDMDGLTDQFIYFDGSSTRMQLTIMISAGTLLKGGDYKIKTSNSISTSEFYKTYFSGFDSK